MVFSGTTAGNQQSSARVLDGRPIVMQFGGLSECVMLLPVIEAIAERWGRSVNVIVGQQWARQVLSLSRSVGEVRTIGNLGGLRLLPNFQLRRTIDWLAGRPDSPIFCMDRSRTAISILQRAGCCPLQLAFPRIGHRTKPSIAADLELADRAFDGIGNAAPRRMAVDSGQRLGQYRSRSMDQQRMSTELIIVCTAYRPGDAPVTSPGTERRSLSDWNSVIVELTKSRPNASLVIVGPGQFSTPARRLTRSLDNTVRHVSSDSSIEAIMDLCSEASTVISADPGISYLSAAIGCQVVVLHNKRATVVPNTQGFQALQAIQECYGKRVRVRAESRRSAEPNKRNRPSDFEGAGMAL